MMASTSNSFVPYNATISLHNETRDNQLLIASLKENNLATSPYHKLKSNASLNIGNNSTHSEEESEIEKLNIKKNNDIRQRD